MNAEEWAEYQKRYRARWRRWLDELSWSRGAMTTWKPVMTEPQRKAHERYVKDHKLPF